MYTRKRKKDRIVHVRMDSASYRALQKLCRATGLSDSELIRRSIASMSDLDGAPTRAFVGAGEFASGVNDLASNERHLRGLGAS
ncbi:MAG: ribbon-helix-helix protein, CopG family [Deltaproteobacteria bacterium]|nr:ribbon-helix-helix protein, CopG family [Deltaproteobacteria bacterium]